MSRVIIFGYGAVGREVAARMIARGDDVVIAQRSCPRNLPSNCVFRVCDLLQSEAVAAACADREVVVCAAGFRYHSREWERDWPIAMQSLRCSCTLRTCRTISHMFRTSRVRS